ncbi:hypothetical protein B0H21DRAFT_714121 [Amylocystis lapponica]|nr:hypothetical protein B0H21DRAFT_714121 [Amylocystis lapponica]
MPCSALSSSHWSFVPISSCFYTAHYYWKRQLEIEDQRYSCSQRLKAAGLGSGVARSGSIPPNVRIRAGIGVQNLKKSSGTQSGLSLILSAREIFMGVATVPFAAIGGHRTPKGPKQISETALACHNFTMYYAVNICARGVLIPCSPTSSAFEFNASPTTVANQIKGYFKRRNTEVYYWLLYADVRAVIAKLDISDGGTIARCAPFMKQHVDKV